MVEQSSLSFCSFVSQAYTEEDREDATLCLDLELVIWGYLMLEYSLSFNLFLWKQEKKKREKQKSTNLLIFLTAGLVNVPLNPSSLPAPPPVSSGPCLCTAAPPCRWTCTGPLFGPCPTSAVGPSGWSLGCRCHSRDLDGTNEDWVEAPNKEVRLPLVGFLTLPVDDVYEDVDDDDGAGSADACTEETTEEWVKNRPNFALTDCFRGGCWPTMKISTDCFQNKSSFFVWDLDTQRKHQTSLLVAFKLFTGADHLSYYLYFWQPKVWIHLWRINCSCATYKMQSNEEEHWKHESISRWYGTVKSQVCLVRLLCLHVFMEGGQRKCK